MVKSDLSCSVRIGKSSVIPGKLTPLLGLTFPPISVWHFKEYGDVAYKLGYTPDDAEVKQIYDTILVPKYPELPPSAIASEEIQVTSDLRYEMLETVNDNQNHRYLKNTHAISNEEDDNE